MVFWSLTHKLFSPMTESYNHSLTCLLPIRPWEVNITTYRSTKSPRLFWMWRYDSLHVHKKNYDSIALRFKNKQTTCLYFYNIDMVKIFAFNTIIQLCFEDFSPHIFDFFQCLFIVVSSLDRKALQNGNGHPNVLPYLPLSGLSTFYHKYNDKILKELRQTTKMKQRINYKYMLCIEKFAPRKTSHILR